MSDVEANPFQDALRQFGAWDPAWSTSCAKVAGDPWRSGVLSRKLVELVSLAINVACTNLNAEGTRRHIRGALDAGAKSRRDSARVQMRERDGDPFVQPWSANSSGRG